MNGQAGEASASRRDIVLPNGDWCDDEPQPRSANLLGLAPLGFGQWRVTILDPVAGRETTLPRGA